MKKLFLPAIAAMLFAASCDVEDPVNPPPTEPVVPELSLHSDNDNVTIAGDYLSARISTDFNGTQATVAVETNLDEWSITDGPEWIRVSKSDESATFEIAPNQSTESRTADYIIRVENEEGELTASVTVEQSGVAAAELSLGKSTASIDAAGGQAEVTYTTNQSSITVTVPDTDSWLAAQTGEGKITFAAAANESGSMRSAQVAVTAGTGDNTASATVIVSQEPFATPNFTFVIRTGESETARTLSLPAFSTKDETVKFTVDFGDGTVETFDANLSSADKHLYTGVNTEYTVTIATANTVSAFSFTNHARLVKVVNNTLDMSAVTTLDQAFYQCRLLESVAANTITPCSNLVSAKRVFQNCIALKEVGAGLFAGLTKLVDATGIFQGCTALPSAPAKLFSGCKEITDLQYVFGGCTALKTVAPDIFEGCTSVTSVYATFTESGLTEVPEGLFDTFGNLREMEYCFGTCRSLAKVPVSLLDNCRKVTAFDYAFTRCPLVGESPYTVISGNKVHLYQRKNYPDDFNTPLAFDGCFNGCIDLIDFGAIMQSGWGEE